MDGRSRLSEPQLKKLACTTLKPVLDRTPRFLKGGEAALDAARQAGGAGGEAHPPLGGCVLGAASLRDHPVA
ncbi:MAG TPA: hypothetical protein DEP84_21200 [Chloroflexi bacterium]|nr:hypothetical protein [Chloroflexota bacterium]